MVAKTDHEEKALGGKKKKKKSALVVKDNWMQGRSQS